MEREPRPTPGIVALPGARVAADHADVVVSMRRSLAGRAELARRIVELGFGAWRETAHRALVASPHEVVSLCVVALRDFSMGRAHRAAILDVVCRRPAAEVCAAVDGHVAVWRDLLRVDEWRRLGRRLTALSRCAGS